MQDDIYKRTSTSRRERVPLLHPWRDEATGRRSNTWTLVFAFLTYTLLPSLIFAVVSMSFMIGYHLAPRILLAIAVVFVAAFGGNAAVGFFAKGLMCKKSFKFVVCAFALITGATVGTSLALTDLVDYWPYELRRHYTNVAPDESAAAHSDASVVIFTQGARPDVARAAGYMQQGHRYCVAPITLESDSTVQLQQPAIQYWAVGKDCCMGRRGFVCDDAANPDASSGLVKMGRREQQTFIEAIISSNEMDYYEKAVSMALSKFDLASPPERMYVRFVQDVRQARAAYWTEALKSWGWQQFQWLVVWMVVGAMTILIAVGDPDDKTRYGDHLEDAKVNMVAQLNHYF